VKKSVRLAAALKYEMDEGKAPMVVASGKGEAAEKIIELAETSGVPLHSDDALAEVLTSLEVGTEIPEELYQAVAQVLAFVWQLDKKYGKG